MPGTRLGTSCLLFLNILIFCIYLFGCAGSYGEGIGTPLQYFCLENPMDGGAWGAAVHGVAKSRTPLSDFTFMHWRRKWQPTPVFLPGESQGRGSLVGCRLLGRTESDATEATWQQQLGLGCGLCGLVVVMCRLLVAAHGV